jgi:amino acid efflux transporter
VGLRRWEALTSLAADFKRPDRDVPRATVIALVVVAVLYLGVATTSLATLGAATATTEAPLAELLAIGVGGQVKVITAVVALLLTLGTMNAYFAGGAKLGAALARDGALPSWLARGSQTGEVPRRSLALGASISTAAVIAAATLHISTRQIVLLTIGAFVIVYVLGTAAAVKLLPRRTWSRRSAVIALASSLVLLVMVGPYLLWPLTVAVLALIYQARRRRALSRARSDAETPESVRSPALSR